MRLSIRALLSRFRGTNHLSLVGPNLSHAKIGVYLSDVSGAFDRVDSEILLSKLHRAGVGPVFLRFLCNFLSPRQAVVLVHGSS